MLVYGKINWGQVSRLLYRGCPLLEGPLLIAWFRVQFGINSMSEWLLIAQGEAECSYANHECY